MLKHRFRQVLAQALFSCNAWTMPLLECADSLWQGRRSLSGSPALCYSYEEIGLPFQCEARDVEGR